jgi:arylsulfatase
MSIAPDRPACAAPHPTGNLKSLFLQTLGMIGLLAAMTAPATVSAAEPDRRPNVVVILADDMGFADMGSFGSEIRTPNLDSLANDGVRFNNFYTHATCSPSRSMLLTGVDSHQNGLGNMGEWIAPNQVGVPGYEGHLRKDVPTLPELLRQSGYHTYMVGKWHLGKQPDQIPAARGFERDFDLPPSEWSKISVILDHEGVWKWARGTSLKRLSASCVRLRLCWRRAGRQRMHVGGSRLPSRHIIVGARNMAV